MTRATKQKNTSPVAKGSVVSMGAYIKSNTDTRQTVFIIDTIQVKCA
jgi:hypothetical protein